jgi:hypothetical protein
MKVYVSSTYQDLIEHRAAVDRTLRRMGHDVIGMEQYVAEGSKPVERCRADVRNADVYVVIVAWRYGYVPDTDIPPLRRSITEIEHDEAIAAGKPVLAFLLDPETPWPLNRVDAIGSTPGAGNDISLFRTRLGSAYLAGIFRSPDDLASQVAAAVAAQGLTRHMVDRVLAQTSVASGDMGAFGQGTSVSDSTLYSIKEMIAGAGATRALVVDLGLGDLWWSTRLFLLASLLRSLTGVRQVVFRDATGRFAGMASPAALVDGLAAAFPLLDEYGRQLRSPDASADTERETDRQVDLWNALIREKSAGNESVAKVGVRLQLLERWLGERLISRCIRVEAEDLTMPQVQQIVDSLVPDVPVERKKTIQGATSYELQVVDRDAFALELAREWVRVGLPRTPVR